MSKFYSATTNSFYDSAIVPETQIPEDKVEVTEELYNEAMSAQAQGCVIYSDIKGNPSWRFQACSPCDCLKHETTEAGTETLGHVNIASSLDDTGAVSVPTAAQVKTALGNKANSSDVVKLMGDQTINGIKTFVNLQIEPTSSGLGIPVFGLVNGSSSYGGGIAGFYLGGAYPEYFVSVPKKTGTLALISDIPDVSGIETNAAAIATHESRISNAEENIGLNAQAIAENEEAIAAETTRAQAAEKTNADAITSLTSRVSTNETNIAKKANDSDVVHLGGVETITGTKTFNSALILGSSISKKTADSYLGVFGSNYWETGAGLALYGGEHDSLPGVFTLQARKDSSNVVTLKGTPDGNLTWNGYSVLTKGNTPYITESYSNGATWYRKWSDGFIEQGLYLNNPSSSGATATFPTAFNSMNYNVILSSVAEHILDREPTADVTNKTTTSILVYGDSSVAIYACGY